MSPPSFLRFGDHHSDTNLSLGERMLEANEKPLEIQRKFDADHPNDHLKFVLKKGNAVPKTAVPTIKLTKIPFRIYCEFANKTGPTFRPVLVSENMTAMNVVFLAIEKFNIKSNLTIQDYSLVLVNDETGAKRTLQAEESPLVVKNELGKKISCHLTKALSTIDHRPIRIFGNRVWQGEGYKTIFVNTSQTANDAISLAIDKFKYKGVNPNTLQIMRISVDGTGNLPFRSTPSFSGEAEPCPMVVIDIANEKAMEGGDQPFKEKWDAYVLLKKANFVEPVAPSSAASAQEPVPVSEMAATAEDVRKLLDSDTILNMGEESLGNFEFTGDIDSAFANVSDVRPHHLFFYYYYHR